MPPPLPEPPVAGPAAPKSARPPMPIGARPPGSDENPAEPPPMPVDAAPTEEPVPEQEDVSPEPQASVEPVEAPQASEAPPEDPPPPPAQPAAQAPPAAPAPPTPPMPIGGAAPPRPQPPRPPSAEPTPPPPRPAPPSRHAPAPETAARRVRVSDLIPPVPPGSEAAPPRARRAHRYRETDDDPTTAAPIPPPTRAAAPAPPNGGPGFNWLPSTEAPAPQQLPPEPNGGRRPANPPPGPTRAQAPVLPAPTQPARPAKKAAKPVPQRGWRGWVYRLTRINLGLSPDEKYELELRARVSRRPRGSYQIGVLGLKGGAGKTTTTVTLGTTLAQVRGDRILVLDADPGCGNLAERTGRSSPASIADLVAAKDVSHYNDVRAHTSVNGANLEILPAEDYTAAQRGLSGEDMRYAVTTVSKFYNLVLADCGAGLFDPVTRGVLDTASAVVIVTNVSVDSARQAAAALDWLQRNGFQDLLSRACVVVNHVAQGETNVAEKELVRRFEQQVQPGRVIVLPWDKHIAAGTEIQFDQLDPLYRRRVLELAAALSDDFERAGRR
nr:MinD/ParA family protein [Mycobacterium kubicae]